MSRFFLYMMYVLFSVMLPDAALASDQRNDYKYVINLELLDKARPYNLREYGAGYIIYQVKVKIRGKIRYRTRMGFFSSRNAAKSILIKVKSKYKSAWIDAVRKYDQKYLKRWLGKKSISQSGLPTRSAFMLSEQETAQVMEKARVSIVNQDYPTAIKLYTKVLSRGTEKYKRNAQEYLGVAREKNGQYAHAKAEYEQYLRLYPDGEDADRVRMRLNGLLTARNHPRKKLAKSTGPEKAIWDEYGYFTEFYRRDNYKVDEATAIDNSSLTSSLGLFARRRGIDSDIKMEMTGSYLYDIDNPQDQSDERLTSLFIDYSNRPKTTSIRLGRQTHNTSGVLGRMDGIWADYQLTPELKINAVAGYPVQLTDTNQIQTNRKFHGLSIDIGPFDKDWNFNLFQIQQTVDGMTDRDAVGGEIRYIGSQGVFFTLIDYDKYYNELNKAYMLATWRTKSQQSFTLTYDKTKSPYLLTVNALQGQTFQSIEEMSGTYSEEEIKQIAKDRTADYEAVSLNGTLPMNKKLYFDFNVTASNLSGTPSSAGVSGTTSTGNEYYYIVQLIGNDVLVKNDTMIGGINYIDGHEYKRTSYRASERLVFAKKWRTKFQFVYELTDKTTGAKTTAYKPSFGIDYLYSRTFRLEADLLYDTRKTTGDTLNTKENYLSFSAGFIYDF